MPALIDADAACTVKQSSTCGGDARPIRCCSLGQITNALFEVGGQYRRSM